MAPTRLLVAALLLLLTALPALAGGGPAETVVLVNTRSPDSVAVGEHYAEARDLPPSHVLRVECETGLQTTLETLTPEVVEPLRRFLAERRHVKFVVLTQGMPIRARTLGGNWVSTAAALALAETAFCGRVQGRLPTLRNPYQAGAASSLPTFDGGRLLLVTALISSTADEARALVERSVASDGTAPEDALVIFQDARGNANVRNGTYDAARGRLEELGLRTTHDAAGKEAVRDRKRVIGYVSGGSYSAMAVESLVTNEFLPGAICDMLQSFGAVPENFAPDGKGGKQFPVTHLVRAGITGVHGAVAEPYTVAFPPADLIEPYVRGYTLAEAFHQRIPVAYWMNLVLGDPLCAPYADRPEVDLSVRDGVIEASAKGAERMDAFVDGHPVGGADGGTLSVPLPALPRGPHHVLVQAVGPGTVEPVGWTALTVEAGHPAVPTSWTRVVTSDQPLRVVFAGEPPALDTLSVYVGDAAVAGEVTRDGDALRFRPSDALPAGAELRVELTDTWTGTARVGAARLSVTAPESVVAGEAFELAVAPQDATGEPCAGWTGRVEVHSLRPAIRHRALDAEGTAVRVPLEFTDAGKLELEVRLPGEGLRERVALTVEPAEAAHATTPLSKVPVGQVVDLPVVVQDRYGNRVTKVEGTVSAALPSAPHARLPEPVELRDGRAVLRDLVLLERGRLPLELRIDGRKTSQPTEGIEGVAAAVRAWSVSTPERGTDADGLAAAVLGDPKVAEQALVDGAVVGGATFRRVRLSGDELLVDTGGTRDDDVVAAVTPLEVVADCKVELHAAGTSALSIAVDGDLVYEGTPEAENARRKPVRVAEVELSAGRHVVAVVARRKGRFSFQLRLDDGKGGHPRPVTVTGDVPPGPTRSASGRVTRGGGAPLSGVELLVEAGGDEYRVVSDALGRWAISGLAPGPLSVAPATTQAGLTPPSRSTDSTHRNAHDLDFELRDETPPTVELPDLPRRPRCGARLRLSPTVDDDGGVARVTVHVAGHAVGPATTDAPWTLDVDVSAIEPGRHEVVVVATDAAGNEGRSEAVTFEFVGDDGPPELDLSGIRDGRRVKRRSTVTARAKDGVGLASIRFLLDGKPLGDPVEDDDSAKAVVDPDELPPGEHLLECIATDVDGHETRATLRFETR